MMLWKCARVASGTEKERGNKEGKKKKPGVKPDIFLPHAPPRNRGNAVRIKMSSWKLEFGHRKKLHIAFADRERTHMHPHKLILFELDNYI
jgi:hypothetical protein